MSRRSFAVATVLSIIALGVPITGCSNLLADAHYNNALEEFDEGNFEAAIELLDSAIAIREEADYYTTRGNSKSSLQNFEDAIKDYDKAIEIDPENASAYYNRGVTRQGIDDTQGAMSDHNNAIKYNPDSKVA